MGRAGRRARLHRPLRPRGLDLRPHGHPFPYGTFVINITGCFVIGLALTILDAHAELPSAWRLALPIGFVGAYTTFSTFEFETYRAAQDRPMIALLYLVSSVVLGYLAVFLGIQAGKLFH